MPSGVEAMRLIRATFYPARETDGITFKAMFLDFYGESGIRGAAASGPAKALTL
jgi:hypothetical protein